MFTFFATIFSLKWISENWKIIVYVLAGLFALIVVIKKYKQKKAMEAQTRRQEAAKRRMEEIQKDFISFPVLGGLENPDENSPYQRIENAIAKNPLSEKYRVPVQQTRTNFHFWELDRFMAKARSRFVALDIETTGLDQVDDEIVEIGAVRVINGRITDRFSQLINPNQRMPEDVTAINHITDEMLAGKPMIYEIMPDLLEFIGEDVVAVHNAAFDAGFLSQASMRYRFKLHKKYFDTMDLKVFWPSAKNKKLSSLLEAAGIENQQAHRALGDAEALAKLIIKTIEKSKALEE